MQTKMDAQKYGKLIFGDYIETHEKNVIKDLMEPWTQAVIQVGPTRNLQGSIKFMCIETGNKMARRKYKRLPMPDSAIEKVEAFTAWVGVGMGIIFRNKNHEEYEWNNQQYIVPEAEAENAPSPNVPM